MSERVWYSRALVQSLEQSLISAFKSEYVKLTPKPANPGAGFHVRLANGTRQARRDDNVQQDVTEIIVPNCSYSTFYFGFIAAFAIGPTIKKHYLKDASISIFQDILGDLAPFFRAEWHEEAASDERCKHAQPHWHFVQRPRRIERIVKLRQSEHIISFAEERESELFSGLADCGGFHFAMTSQWDTQDAPPYKNKLLFDSDAVFLKWFAGLTRYIAGQIAYMLETMPGKGRAFEFTGG